MSNVDYKQKYLDLRSKFVKSCDLYYRTGYEDGVKDGTQQSQMPQPQPEINPETGEPVSPSENQMINREQLEENPQDQNELDNHINELENLVSKGEKPKVTDLRKIVDTIANIRKSQKEKLNSNHKQVVVSKQKELVDNILKKWEKDANERSTMDDFEKMIISNGIDID